MAYKKFGRRELIGSMSLVCHIKLIIQFNSGRLWPKLYGPSTEYLTYPHYLSNKGAEEKWQKKGMAPLLIFLIFCHKLHNHA